MQFHSFILDLKQRRVKVLLVYSIISKIDKNLVNQLNQHLSTISHKNIDLLTLNFKDSSQYEWTRREIDIIVPLVSPSLIETLSNGHTLTSRSFIRQLRELREHKKIKVVPVILRPIHNWQSFFDDLQALPKSGKSISDLSSSERDYAFIEVVEFLDKRIDEVDKYRGNILNYKKHFSEILQREYPLRSSTIENLKTLKKNLALDDDDVAKIEEELVRRKEREVARQEAFETVQRDVIQIYEKVKPNRFREILIGLSILCFFALTVTFLHRPSLDTDDYIQRGRTDYAEKKFKEAIEEFSRAIELDPNNFSHYNDRGDAHYAQGNLNAAIGDYSQAITFNGENVYGYRRRGEAYLKLGKIKEAINNFKVAANLYQKQGNVSEYQNMMDLVTKLESDLPLIGE